MYLIPGPSPRVEKGFNRSRLTFPVTSLFESSFFKSFNNIQKEE